MYYNNQRGSSRGGYRGGNGGYSQRGRSFGGGRGGRRMRFFDPTSVIEKQAELESIATSKEEVAAYIPVNSFASLPIESKLKENILAHGYTTPTPIQDLAIPKALEGHDIIGTAKTGTGKTAAFLIPLIDKVYKNRKERVLIVAPTRELAVQIEAEFREFAKGMGIYSVICIGGVGMGSQIHGLRRGANFVIGTPGRLMDLERQRVINFGYFGNVVLDEVDRILDMGFIEDLSFILDRLPQQRQSFFFSATMPSKVDAVARGFLQDPIAIAVKSNEPAQNVHQELVRIGGGQKIEILHELLIKDGFDKVLVFGRTKFGIEKLSIELRNRGFRVEAIHGNKSQNQRQRALTDFKNNRVQILLATDIVARGLDIDSVTHVINYDLPETYEDYIHRIGRTGRADKKGIAITFV